MSDVITETEELIVRTKKLAAFCDRIDNLFVAQQGPPHAWMQLPGPLGAVRLPYVTLITAGATQDQALDELMQALTSIREIYTRNADVYLFWRLSHPYVGLERPFEDRDVVTARTRVAIISAGFLIPDWDLIGHIRKHEGAPHAHPLLQPVEGLTLKLSKP